MARWLIPLLLMATAALVAAWRRPATWTGRVLLRTLAAHFDFSRSFARLLTTDTT